MNATWLDTGEPIPPAVLAGQGVTSERLPTDEAEYRGPLERIMAARGYLTMDQVKMTADMPNFQAICDKFSPEHLHTEDEVRFVVAGGGVFDIRSLDDRWMHVVVEPGDFILVPANRNHRFMLTEAKRIQCVRLFKDASGWTPHYRG